MTAFKFTDTAGQAWDLKIALPAAERIDRSDMTPLDVPDFSFLDPPKEFFTEHLSSLGVCAFLAYLIVEPQATAAGLTQEDFAARLDGAALAALQDALWDAVMDFFPRWRTVLSTLRQTHRERQQGLEQRLTTILQVDYAQALDAELEKELNKIVQRLADATSAANADDSPSVASGI